MILKPIEVYILYVTILRWVRKKPNAFSFVTLKSWWLDNSNKFSPNMSS